MSNIKSSLASFTMLLILTTASIAGQSEINYERMQRELGIMETILKTIMSGNDIQEYYTSPYVRGSYLEGYGVIYQLSYSSRNYRGIKAPEARESFDKMRESLTNFYADYASLINQVNPDETISLIVYPNDASLNRWTTSRTTDPLYANEVFEPHPFILSARKSDLANLSLETRIQLNRVVKYTPISKTDEMYITNATKEDVLIMRRILERSLEDHFRISISSSAVQGSYIKDYGVLFNLSTSSSIYSTAARITLLATGILVVDSLITGDKGIAIRIDNPDRFIDQNIALLARQERSKSIEKQKDELIDLLLEVLGTYGGTIKELKPNDRVTVYMTPSSSSWSFPSETNLIISLEFKDIEDFQRGRITLNTLKNRSKTIFFQ